MAERNGSTPLLQSVARQPAASELPAVPFTLEAISRVAGLSALVGAVVAGAGMLYTYSYLSAWGIAPPLVKMDPLSAALRAEGVAYQVLLFGSAFVLVRAIYRWKPRRRTIRVAAMIGMTVVVGALAVESVAGGFVGAAIGLLGGSALGVLRVLGLTRRRTSLLVASVVILLSSYVTGVEIGRATRDDPSWRREVQLVTDVAVGDLRRSTLDTAEWQYDELYLIFRDDRQLYVGVPGRPDAWLVDAGHVLSLRIAPPPGNGP